ncbi:MAG: GNAT family protein [Patescibacteria group bacterium]
MISRAELGSSGGANNHEIPARGRIELRMGDPRLDAKELARLLSQESAMPHLVGVVPHRVSEEERLRIETQYPVFPLITATTSDVRKYYMKNKDQILIVAQKPGVEGKLYGTVAVQGGNPGVLTGNISKLVVDEDDQKQGIGAELVRAANAIIFGYLNFEQAIANVVLNVPNDDAPQKVLRREGFKVQTQLNRKCVSWDTKTGMLVVRDALPFLLERQDYFKRPNAVKDMKRYLSMLQVTSKIA